MRTDSVAIHNLAWEQRSRLNPWCGHISRSIWVGRSGPDEPGDSGGGFPYLCLGRVAAFGDGLGDAVRQVIFEKFQGDGLQGSCRGGDLGEHVDAVGFLVDHPLNAADLTFGAPQPLCQLGFSFLVSSHVAIFAWTPCRSLYPLAV